MNAAAPGEPLHIVALGASTALGRCAWASAAAVRASIANFTQHPDAIDTVGAPVHVALAAWLDPALQGLDRFEALLDPAIEQATAIEGLDPARTALAIALPDARPGLPEQFAERLPQRAARRHPQRFQQMAAFAAGHGAGFAALAAARRKLASGQIDACIVCGVDSFHARATIEWLEDRGQLHGAGPLNNAWGFIPGEGAGAILLMRDGVAARLHVEPLASLVAVSTAIEAKHYAEAVCIGEGLTAAFRPVLAELPAGTQVTDIVCDLNGETHRAEEYMFTVLRSGSSFRKASDTVTPANCWGDIGAAGLPLHAALAAIAGLKGYAHGPLALVFGSSDAGARGAALFRTAGSA